MTNTYSNKKKYTYKTSVRNHKVSYKFIFKEIRIMATANRKITIKETTVTNIFIMKINVNENK